MDSVFENGSENRQNGEHPKNPIAPYKPCGAKKRDGSPCKAAAMKNGRCRIHGGKSLSGAASGTFKHGRFSTCAPAKLASKIEQGLSDPELLSLRDDVALQDAFILERLEKVKEDPDSPAATVHREEIRQLLMEKAKTVRAESKRMLELNVSLRPEQALQIFKALFDAVRRNVKDTDVLGAIQDDFSRIMGLNPVLENESTGLQQSSRNSSTDVHGDPASGTEERTEASPRIYIGPHQEGSDAGNGSGGDEAGPLASPTPHE